MFSQSTDENYYKPKKSNSAFNSNCIEYQIKGNKDKNLSMREYLYRIITHLRDIINDHKVHRKLKVHTSNDYKTKREWEIQVSMEINVVSFKDPDEIRIMHTKSDNIDILMGSETNDVIKELFKSLLQKYQERLQESMRISEFIFDGVNSLYYHLQKISLKRGGSYVYSLKWLNNKKATINPKNNDNNGFQYTLNVASDYHSIRKDHQRI